MLREEWDGGLTAEESDDEEPFAPLDELKDFAGEDVSFAEWVAQSDVPEEGRGALLGYVEGFNAADAGRIGVKALGVQQKAEDAIDGSRAWHVRGGYVQLAEYLARKVQGHGGVIRLGEEVRALEWGAGKVSVTTAQGVVRARKCVVALPLGVLQRVNGDGIAMQPEPRAIAQARRMEMGHAMRLTMVWRERWWERSEAIGREELEQMSFLFTMKRLPRVWWTARLEKEPFPTLTGWLGGPQTRQLEGKDASVLGEEACAALAEVFGMSAGEVRGALVETHFHDWSRDPFSLGAYSYVPVGAMDAPQAMTMPEEETIFFAGEHTDVTGHWGTVHAAIRSGLRVVEQVVGRK